MTYPGFQALPRGIKQMLVASESSFFSEAKASASTATMAKHARRTSKSQLRSHLAATFSQDWKN